MKRKTYQEMLDLKNLALSGDKSAEKSYRDEARLIAKSANQQLLTIERAGFTNTSAYKSAKKSLGGKKRFSESVKTIDIKDLEKQVRAITEFKNSKEYSLSFLKKAKESADKIKQPLRDAFKKNDKRLNVNDKIALQMNELFMSDAWKEVKSSYGRGSTNLVNAAAEAFRKGKTIDDLESSYNLYMEARDDDSGRLNMDIVQMWEQFAPYV